MDRRGLAWPVAGFTLGAHGSWGTFPLGPCSRSHSGHKVVGFLGGGKGSICWCLGTARGAVQMVDEPRRKYPRNFPLMPPIFLAPGV